MSGDLYRNNVAREYLFRAELGPAEKLFYSTLLAERGLRRVLDCACGAGLEARFLAECGFDVVGADVSPAMLDAARGNLRRTGVPLHELDYRELSAKFGPEFDAVLCLGASLIHMPGEEDVLRALESMRGVLAEGGILVLDQGITDWRWKQKKRFSLVGDSTDCSRIYAIDYLDERRARFNVLDVVRDTDPPRLEVWISEVFVLLHADQRRLLAAAGFRSVEFFGSFERDPYDENESRRLIAVARR